MTRSNKKKVTVLILGATGMLGHTLFKALSANPSLAVFATARHKDAKSWFSPTLRKHLIIGLKAEEPSSVTKVITKLKPDVVINCIGLIKQLEQSDDVMQAIPINTILPLQLAQLTKELGSRLILMSTDCVFSGNKGDYRESDSPDCSDLYGQSKLLGEITDQKHVLTLRTSIIGHELNSQHSLVDWFLNQKKQVTGYTQAIYSGLPTIAIANIISEKVLPNSQLHGLYHLSAKPISKFDLLALIAKIYRKKITIKKSSSPKIDRSLNCTKFQRKTGYKPQEWETLIDLMHQNYLLDHQT